MNVEIDKINELGWINNSLNLISERFKFNQKNFDNAIFINDLNKNVRDLILNEYLNEFNKPQTLKCCIDIESDDVVIAEIDRYGLPLRTVINKKNGLVRSDPYYSNNWLERFYSIYYRDLYTSDHVSLPSFFAEQIKTGENVYTFVNSFLKVNSEVCEIGCGMGGILVPFKLNGHNITGIDLGDEYIEKGNEFNLNLHIGSIEYLINKGIKFDLIIINHVLEHIPEINDFLSKVNSLLTDNGMLYIAVPGIYSIPRNYNSNTLLFLQNAHCWHFTKNTLSKLLNISGFEILKIEDEISCLSKKTNRIVDHFDLSNEYFEVIDNLKRYEESILEIKEIKPQNKNIFLKVFRKGIRLLIKILNRVFDTKYTLQ